jgi:hypothetical protein
MSMKTTTTTAFAVMDRDWSGYTAHDTVRDPAGSITVTEGGETYQATRVIREVPTAFTEAERAWLEARGTVVPHHTYSLQQESFRRAGFALGTPRPGSGTYAEVAALEVVIAIATEDRYGIFPASTVVRRYATIDEWRSSGDAPQEES